MDNRYTNRSRPTTRQSTGQGGGRQSYASANNHKSNQMKIVLIAVLVVVLLSGAILGAVLLFGKKSGDLATPSNLRLLGDQPNTVGWDSVNNAEQYTVRVDGNKVNEQKFVADDNLYNLNLLELNRTFYVDVQAHGGGLLVHIVKDCILKENP
ncbi:MAG: hypothetical protein FWF56_06935 [Firmicutes bacterium]|nr:hypothetical protein [Bacillota bacterium]